MFFNNSGKYDPTVRVRPDQFPILCSPLYDTREYGWDWDHIQDMQEEVSTLHGIILNDDVPALREMLRLVGPELLYWEQDFRTLSPTMIFAAEMGRVRILETLFDYRDTLTAAQYESVKIEYELLERESGSDMARCWGTPLTTACMCARVDVVRLLLKRMPEVDINACDKFGYTPLQAVTRHSQRASSEDVGNHKESMRRIAIVRLLLAHGANMQAPDKSFERVGQTVQDAFDASIEQGEFEDNLRPLVYRPGGIGNALIQALARPAGGDVDLTRMLIDEVGIDVHKGYFFATAAFDGRGCNGVADDVDDEGVILDRDAEYKKFEAAYKVDPVAAHAANQAAIDAADASEKLLKGPGQGPDTYLTPLAAAALFRNAAGVTALLQTPGTDFYQDLVSPSIPETMLHARNSDDDSVDAATAAVLAETTAMRPLHAAMIGRRYEVLRAPFFHEPELYRDGILYKEAGAADDRAAVRVRDGLPEEPLELQLEIQAAKDIVDEDTLHPRTRAARQTEAARKAYLDDCVATVQLLTADPAVCAATINATHPHDGLHYTPLQLGARFDRLPMLRVLLDAGADPRPPVPHTGRSVFFSLFASLLRLCSNTGRCDWGGGGLSPPAYHPEVVAIDASIGTAGMTRLLRDLLGSDTDDVERLARINEADTDGNTALHWAMGYDLPHAQAALLALGARPDARNDAGEVPTQGTPPTTTRLNKYARHLE
ncbi:hypothetical protein SEUCBS139899_009873 [Sporothrix eucalyptigena]|uniref:Ankyrin repeat protein n=1 Tax=Sporothrix eucalyptigena TaxID=1812306 RepID=A0ABP0CZ42_9PEZI